MLTPLNGRIAYSRGIQGLAVMNADSSGHVRIVNSIEVERPSLIYSFLGEPDFSRDGRNIAYSASRSINNGSGGSYCGRIRKINAGRRGFESGTNEQSIQKLLGSYPRFSHDGTRSLF